MKKCVIVPSGYHRYVVTVRYDEGVLTVLCYAPTSSDALDTVVTNINTPTSLNLVFKFKTTPNISLLPSLESIYISEIINRDT